MSLDYRIVLDSIFNLQQLPINFLIRFNEHEKLVRSSLVNLTIFTQKFFFSFHSIRASVPLDIVDIVDVRRLYKRLCRDELGKEFLPLDAEFYHSRVARARPTWRIEDDFFALFEKVLLLANYRKNVDSSINIMLQLNTPLRSDFFSSFHQQ